MKSIGSPSSMSSLAFGVAMVAFAVATILIPRCADAHPNFSRNKTLLCTTMEPGHGVIAQPDSTFKDFFALNATAEEGGHFYHLRIDALTKEQLILGYLIEARDACTGEILGGNWNTAQADQILNCNGATANGVNAVHHRPRRSPAVPQVKHAWVPINMVTSLDFKVTVVATKSKYWVMQSVPVVPCNKKSS